MIIRNWRLPAIAAGVLSLALAQPGFAQKPVSNTRGMGSIVG